MVKLQDYLPNYYDDVYEMQKLVAAEQVDFTKFDDLILRTLLNQFVIQADIQGISIYEDQLGIDVNPNDSLETRRYNVLMRMLPPKPITLKYFKELLKTLDIPASVNVEYAVRNVITKAKRSEISKDQIKRLKYLLNVYLPANLTFSIVITSETQLNTHEYFGTVSSRQVLTSVNPRLKTSAESSMNQYFGSIKPNIYSSAISKPKLIFRADSKLFVFTGASGPQIFVEATSRALMRSSTKFSTNKFIGTIKPQIAVDSISKEKNMNV
ncbi:putative phage tail protein [Companilactobacillus sp. HBUAS59699]|uniref:putative phage tail protein n=1 Tax=Companilactobacillus sp. HBUAS59699 TaxID=3109358 RepID=UPI002FF14ACB